MSRRNHKPFNHNSMHGNGSSDEDENRPRVESPPRSPGSFPRIHCIYQNAGLLTSVVGFLPRAPGIPARPPPMRFDHLLRSPPRPRIPIAVSMQFPPRGGHPAPPNNAPANPPIPPPMPPSNAPKNPCRAPANPPEAANNDAGAQQEKPPTNDGEDDEDNEDEDKKGPKKPKAKLCLSMVPIFLAFYVFFVFIVGRKRKM